LWCIRSDKSSSIWRSVYDSYPDEEEEEEFESKNKPELKDLIAYEMK
jgi:hypothetical protein